MKPALLIAVSLLLGACAATHREVGPPMNVLYLDPDPAGAPRPGTWELGEYKTCHPAHSEEGDILLCDPNANLYWDWANDRKDPKAERLRLARLVKTFPVQVAKPSAKTWLCRRLDDGISCE